LKILRIGDFGIKEAYIDFLVFLPARVDFHLIAAEEAGKRLETELKELEKEHAVEFEADDGLERATGLCDVTDLTITKDESKMPLLYRISGSLTKI